MTKKTVKIELPPDVLKSDLQWPKKDCLSYKQMQELGIDESRLTFYRTSRFGWVLLTLGIRKARRPGQADRSYGVTITDGQVCRVGLGPHVLQVVEVRLSQSNIGRLQKYVDLLTKGRGQAGEIRDRISTRRARTALYRSQQGGLFGSW